MNPLKKLTIFFIFFSINNVNCGYLDLFKSSVSTLSYYVSKPFTRSFSVGYNWFVNCMAPSSKNFFLNAMNNVINIIEEVDEKNEKKFIKLAEQFDKLKKQLKESEEKKTDNLNKLQSYIEACKQKQSTQQKLLYWQKNIIKKSIINLKKSAFKQQKKINAAMNCIALQYALHQQKVKEIKKNISDNYQDYTKILNIGNRIVHDIQQNNQEAKEAIASTQKYLDDLHKAKDQELATIKSLTNDCIILRKQLEEERKKNDLLPKIVFEYNQLKNSFEQLNNEIKKYKEKHEFDSHVSEILRKIKINSNSIQGNLS